ncbi:hypothetical protein ACHAXT_010741 [Thalassiosira profunda]
MSSMLSCIICASDYGGRVVPTQLGCCRRHICFDCAEKHRNAKIAELTGNRKQIPCPLCNRPFHSRNDTPWVVNEAHIELVKEKSGVEVDLTAVREAEAARGIAAASTSSSNNPREIVRVVTRDAADHTETEAVDTGDVNDSAALASTASSATGSPNHDEQSTYDSDEESRFSHNEDESNAQKRSRQSSSSDAKLTVVLNGVKYRDEAELDNEKSQHQLWMEAVASKTFNVYRIRCYNTVSVTSDDRYGRKCSQWCVDGGCIVTCLEIAKLLDEDQRYNGDALKQRVLSVDYDSLREDCQSLGAKWWSEEGTYVKSYKQFVEMRKGDIVALHTKGSSISSPPQTLTFGVVQDNSLTVMNKDEAKAHGFPWNFCNPGKTTTERIGLMSRKVKWLRQGELKAVRGNGQVNWLAEYETKWLGQVGVKTQKYLKEARKEMRSEQFLTKTQAIDNTWIVDGDETALV